MHTMFTDTSFNSFQTVQSMLYLSFAETAMRMHCYSKAVRGEVDIRASCVTRKRLLALCRGRSSTDGLQVRSKSC